MSNPEHRAKLAELERLSAEQDERIRQNEARHQEAIIDVVADQEIARLGSTPEAVAAQLVELADRLLALDLADPDEDEITERWCINPAGDPGEYMVGIEVNGLLYAFGGAGAGDLLIVRRQVGGHSEYALLDENGQPMRWILADTPGTVSGS
jgi:hypothetical protein